MSEEEQKTLVKLLKKLSPGFYPLEIYHEFCRLNTVSFIEIIPIINDGRNTPKILMIKRPKNDLHWPNLYHTPGCTIRPTDTLESTFQRILKDEL